MSVFRRMGPAAALLAPLICGPTSVHAFEPALGPMPISLKHLPVPKVPGLLDGPNPIVLNKEVAIVLGKALFWDINVGSDGMACGSCHYRAGADGRVKNQVAPGGSSVAPGQAGFDLAWDGSRLGPNRTLTAADFPLFQNQDPLEARTPVTRSSGNVVGSSGTFSGQFRSASRVSGSPDGCARGADPVFHVGGIGVRKVTPRNAPSVVNAVFNHRNFWDGRANNVFNGSSPWGDRDPDAGVWVKTPNGTVRKQRLHLINSSLASLATAPPLNTTEMGCASRRLQDVGRKLLSRPPLQYQNVHSMDSVLGPYSLSDKDKLKPGLNTQYKNLIMQAFDAKYWSFGGTIPVPAAAGTVSYSQMEANFPMFFGLAIQLYESTLVSDQSPFDDSARDEGNQPIDLSAAELRGLKQFRKNQCNLCHLGPNFSSAAVAANAAIAETHPEAFGEPTFRISTTTNVVNRIPIFNGSAVTAFFDTGFAATGVAEPSADVGLGGQDDYGNPLSFSRQYLNHLTGDSAGVLDGEVARVRACDFQEPFAVNLALKYPIATLFTPADGIRAQPQATENCFLPAASNAFLPTPAAALAELRKPNSRKMVLATQGAFKTPSLRNIELTGPYMHNGSMATLEQVVEFYARGGNFSGDAKQVTRVFPQPNLQLDEQNRADLIAFLKTLTDDRVRYEKAPFDHPEIRIPHGHIGDGDAVQGGHPLAAGLAKDDYLIIEAVGAEGGPRPLEPFASLLGQ